MRSSKDTYHCKLMSVNELLLPGLISFHATALNELKINVFVLIQRCVQLSFQPIRNGCIGSNLTFAYWENDCLEYCPFNLLVFCIICMWRFPLNMTCPMSPKACPMNPDVCPIHPFNALRSEGLLLYLHELKHARFASL